MTYSDRIALVIDHAKKNGLTQEDIAAKVRKMPGGETFKQATLSALKSRSTSEGSTYNQHIAKACNVNSEWLAMGLGSMGEYCCTPYNSSEKGSVPPNFTLLAQALDGAKYIEERYTTFSSSQKKAEFIWELYKTNSVKQEMGEPPIDTSNIVLLAKMLK
jgi:transcriptional regulator with XRE-family HTH domain